MVASTGIIGNYVIERELGRGGMGVVYAARHRVLANPAAIKLLLDEASRRTDQVERFFNEARAAMAIDHPGIVKILDVGWASDGRAYIAMELLSGESLAVQLQRGPLPIRIAIERAKQIADALAAAHAVGIVHRDLKPDNVMIVAGGGIKLLDFGIAKLGALAGSVKTVTGALIGTPSYMSPEQCEGSVELDARSDLYSLGCVLFAMLTGRPPFDSGGVGGVIGAHLHVPPAALRTQCAAASPALEAVVGCLLAKSREARLQSARAVHKALSAPEIATLGGPDATADFPVNASASSSIPSGAPSAPVSQPPQDDIRQRMTVDETQNPYQLRQMAATHAPPPMVDRSPVATSQASAKRWLILGGIGAVLAAVVIVVVASSRSGGHSDVDAAIVAGNTPDAVTTSVDPPRDAIAVAVDAIAAPVARGSNTGSARGSGSAHNASGTVARGSNTTVARGSSAGSAGTFARGSNGTAGNAEVDAQSKELFARHKRFVDEACACQYYDCGLRVSVERKNWLDTHDLSKIHLSLAATVGMQSGQFAVCIQRASHHPDGTVKYPPDAGTD